MKRFGVSMEDELVELLDQLTRQQGYPNRSETLRSLVREKNISSYGAHENKDVTAVLTLVYQYGKRIPRVSLSPYPGVRILANLQLHLEEGITMKLIVLHGPNDGIHRWAEGLIKKRGIVGKLMVTATDEIFGGLEE